MISSSHTMWMGRYSNGNPNSGTRVAVNTSPEPVSNVAVSVAEDVAVAGVVTVARFDGGDALPAASVAVERAGPLEYSTSLAGPRARRRQVGGICSYLG